MKKFEKQNNSHFKDTSVEEEVKANMHNLIGEMKRIHLMKLVNTICKVYSINFEPPDNDLCSKCHVYPLSCRAWIISILFILNGFTWG